MLKRITASLLILLFLVVSASPVSAQTSTPPGPVYIVQSGDTLWSIAIRFNVSVTDIMASNNMESQEIYVGDRLVIPGLSDLSGTLITLPVPYGESLHSLSRKYHIDQALLIKLNHIVSPTELYAGYNLVLLQQDQRPPLTSRITLAKADSLLELAVRQNTDPWTITQLNGLSGTQTNLPGDLLYLPTGTTTTAPIGIPAILASTVVDPLPIIQGATVQIRVSAAKTVSMSGLLVDRPLHFFTQADGSQIALQGVHAMTNPGLYPLRINVTFSDGSVQSFEQMVLVASGNYLTETINGVDPSTIDPAVTGPEDAWLLSLVTPITPDQLWKGMFQLPVDSQYCVRSKYGNRRTYNGGALFGFHSGIDFGVCSKAHPFDVYAPADGVVVYTGLKTVRGNATIIDHGQGIFSGLYHQAEIYVSIGDHVSAGQLIGKIGNTGRVTGAHLHWDIWVNGIQVNPTKWLNEIFPH